MMFMSYNTERVKPNEHKRNKHKKNIQKNSKNKFKTITKTKSFKHVLFHKKFTTSHEKIEGYPKCPSYR